MFLLLVRFPFSAQRGWWSKVCPLPSIKEWLILGSGTVARPAELKVYSASKVWSIQPICAHGNETTAEVFRTAAVKRLSPPPRSRIGQCLYLDNFLYRASAILLCSMLSRWSAQSCGWGVNTGYFCLWLADTLLRWQSQLYEMAWLLENIYKSGTWSFVNLLLYSLYWVPYFILKKNCLPASHQVPCSSNYKTISPSYSVVNHSKLIYALSKSAS